MIYHWRVDLDVYINVMIHEQLQILLVKVLVKTSLVVRLNILIMFENICLF